MCKSLSGLSSKYKLEKKQINKIKLFDASNKLLLIQLLANIFLKYLSCVTDSLR